MQIAIRHEMIFTFEPAAKRAIQILHLTPRDFDGQHVVGWHISIDRDCGIRSSEDAFGNITHTLCADGPIDRMIVVAQGEVHTLDHSGVVRGTSERFPPMLFLRDTDLTIMDAALRSFADEAMPREAPPLDRLHSLMSAVHETLNPVEKEQADAAATFAAKGGSTQNITNVFVACARHAGIPARHVTGYLIDEDDPAASRTHCWAEAYVATLGWIGFDPISKRCVGDWYVRLACGLDQQCVPPARASHSGGGEAKVETKLRITLQKPMQPMTEHPSQSQQQY